MFCSLVDIPDEALEREIAKGIDVNALHEDDLMSGKPESADNVTEEALDPI